MPAHPPPVNNTEVAAILDHVADLLEIEGANRFRIRAYRNAASTIRDQSRPVAAMVEKGEDLSRLPTIGDDLAGKIAAIVNTGHLPLLDELSGKIPQAIVDATRIAGIGPKRAKALFHTLGLASLDDLRKAASQGRIATVAGFGPKLEARIAKELARADFTTRRIRIDVAETFAEPLIQWIRKIDGVTKAEIAGSYRRRKETVGDLDILVAADDGKSVIERFTRYEAIETIVSKGTTRSTIMLRSGLQVDLRVIPAHSWGAALHYFTGSRAHNIAGRRRAQDRGLKLNEYGLFRGETRIGGATEAEVYENIGLPWIDPALREMRGEIEAAENGTLPTLITINDIRGDLHAHTVASDGRNSLHEMAEAARARGYQYLAITDHSRSETVAGGLDADEIEAQLDEIDALNARFQGFRLLKSCEVDILADGSLDFPDALLKKLDLVVAAVHSHFGLSASAQTTRIIRAMDNPLVSIIAHPTGRLIGMRRPYDLDIVRLVEAASERGCCLELNADPHRLDLDDVNCRMARDAGAKIAISTDAHSTAGLANMRHGTDQARRGWLEAADVLNTQSWRDVATILRR